MPPYFAVTEEKAWVILLCISFIHLPRFDKIKPARRWMPMSARERILAIRLLEKQEKQPEYAKRIGIQVQMKKTDSRNKEKKDA